jgi:hypothetical protein
MAFFNQPVAGECCPDPCARSGPCDPCLTTTTTTVAPTTTTTTTTTVAPTCGGGSFTVSGASSAYNGLYSHASVHGPNEFYTNANSKHLFMDGTTIANSFWVISDDPVGSVSVYSADALGGSCPDSVAWTGAGITIT